MFKSSKSKGQWFLISSVIIVSSFLSISIVLKDFFIIDTSTVARIKEDYYMWNIINEFDSIVEKESCQNMESRLNEFIEFTKSRLSESGYLVHIEYRRYPGIVGGPYSYVCQDDNPLTPEIEPRIRNIEKGVLVATEDAVFYNNINPNLVIRV